MDNFEDIIVPKGILGLRPRLDGIASQATLYPERISTIYQTLLQGADLAFYCSVENGDRYYAKTDSALRPVRATEYILSSFARYLGINVPEIAILENASGETFFGSKDVFSTASVSDAKSILLIPTIEHPSQSSWIGQFTSAVHAFDMFFSNDDRGHYNFLLTSDGMRKTLYALDFVNADLTFATIDKFLPSNSNTVRQKKILQRYHGFDVEVAKNLVDNLGQLDQSFVDQTVAQLPEDWLDDAKRKSFRDMWSNGKAQMRSEALRSYFENGKAI